VSGAAKLICVRYQHLQRKLDLDVELSGDADLVAVLAHRALDDIAVAEFLADLT
jgi:hypothetical protein